MREGKRLEIRARKGAFVGYGDGVKGYRIRSPSEKRVILSRSVVFDEDTMTNKQTNRELEIQHEQDVDDVGQIPQDEEIGSGMGKSTCG